MYNEERQPTKRELNYQQLLGLKKEWPKWVFATQQGKDTDYAVCSINNNFVKVCYKYENYRYKGFFISSTPECIEEFTDMFWRGHKRIEIRCRNGMGEQERLQIQGILPSSRD